MSAEPRTKLPFRRFLIAALSGGLGVFGLAVEATPASAAAATTPPAVAQADQLAD